MRLLLAAFILTYALRFSSMAAEPVWKAGVASIKITPDQPIPLAGYAARVKPFERVEHDLYAKALALEDHAGNRAVLVTTDLIGLSKQIVEPIWDRLETVTKLSRWHILFSASHTHSGPMLRRSDLPIPGIAEADAKNLAAYTRDLQDKLVALVVDSLARLEPAELSWGTGVTHFAMNRREPTERGIILGVNPRGLVDRTGLPGEVVVDYVPLIEQAVGPLRLWIAAYCNDVFGYLPSARVVKEGGYEARGLYTDLGWFTPDAQDVLVSKIRDLADRAGREKPATGQ